MRSIETECLSKLILFSELSLKRVINQYLHHYHRERNHQGKGNLLLFPAPNPPPSLSPDNIISSQQLGGLLKFYQRAA